MFIKKYQVGGIAYTPFIPQSAAPTVSTNDGTSGSNSKTKKETSSKKAALEDDIINILKENGIPSDVNAFLKVANSFLSRSTNLSNSTLFGGTEDGYSMGDLIRLQKYANEIKFNKEKYDDAVKNLNDENAWSDYALDSNGNFYVVTENGLGKATSSDVAKFVRGESDKQMQLVTYSQLAGLREQGLAFNADVLKDLENAYGKESESKHIIELINKFSKNVSKSVDSKENAVRRGLGYLLNSGPNGYYDIKNTDQIKDVNTAITTLWSQLGSAEKNGIKRDIAIRGGDPNSTKDISQEMLNRIKSYAEFSYEADFNKNATEYDPRLTGKTGGSEKLAQNNYLQMIGNGRLLPGGPISITPHAAKISDTGTMIANAYVAGMPIDRNNNPVAMMNFDKFRQKAWAVASTKADDVTFGNKVIDPTETAGIVYDGYSELNVVSLPATHDEHGKLTPDFKKIDGFNKIQAALKNNPNMNELAYAQLCRDNGIDPSEIDREKNEIKFKNTMMFLTFSAYAGDQTIDLTDENKLYLERLDDDKGERIESKYNNSVQYGDLVIDKNSKKYNDLDSSGKRHIYRGNVFLPIEDSFRSMILSGIGEYMPKEAMTDYAARVQARSYENYRAAELNRAYPELNKNTLGQFN